MASATFFHRKEKMDWNEWFNTQEEQIMKTVTTSELQNLQSADSELPIINTLPHEAFEKTRIPGAISIPQDEPDFADRVARAVGAKNKTLVVYCASQQCDSSEKATKKLEEAGFTSVLTYKGGAEAWNKEAHKSAAAASR
jgi:rhodanese-related sulfurtransferase